MQERHLLSIVSCFEIQRVISELDYRD